MISENTFNIAVACWIIAGFIFFVILFRINAPYGKFISSRWGAMIDNRLGWIVMETPPLIFFSLLFFLGDNYKNIVCLVIYIMWMMHYINRDLIFPFRLRTRGKKMPVAIMSFALIFNAFNVFFNGYYLGFLAGYDMAWFTDPRFIIGIIVFITGMAINVHSDNILINIRKNFQEYRIPYGGLFRLVSCPNYLGEIAEWMGFAIMSWSPAGLSFCIWTIVNLYPRAIATHKWYKSRFPDYPESRKAVIPLVI